MLFCNCGKDFIYHGINFFYYIIVFTSIFI